MSRARLRISGVIPAFLIGGVTGASLLAVGYYQGKQLSGAKQFPTPNEPQRPFNIELSEIERHTKTNPLFATGDTLFAFGARSNYFFACRSKLEGSNAIDYAWRSYTNKDSSITKKISGLQGFPIYHSFSPHGDGFSTFTDQSTEKVSWQFVPSPLRHDQAPSYSSLTSWLERETTLSEAGLKKTIVVFGPGASYFARTANACTWHDLPPGLEKIILEKKADAEDSTTTTTLETDKPSKQPPKWIPRIVALGANNTWIGIWEDGRFASSLHPNNKLASEFKPQNSIAYAALWENLVLSPHHGTDYFSATKLGHLDWCIAKHGTADMGLLEMTVAADEYMQMRAKEDKLTFDLGQLVEGRNVSLVIDSDSDWTEERLMRLFAPAWWQAPREFVWSKLKERFG